MDDKRVINLAHECELFDGQHYGSLWADRIRLFAVAIEVDAEQREREACAKVCEQHAKDSWDHEGGALACADKIRARGEQ